MIRLCHLFDRSTGWEHRVGAGQLLNRLPEDRFAQMFGATDGRAKCALASLPRRVDWIPQRPLLAPLAALSLGRYLQERRVELVHAWGLGAAAQARSAGRCPLVVTCFDPGFSRLDAAAIRAVTAHPQPLAIACASQRVCRKLIEQGVPPNVCVVLRPAVDFGRIAAAQRGPLRQQMGIGRGDFLVVLPESAGRFEAHLEAAWAVLSSAGRDPTLKLCLPLGQAERDRIRSAAAASLGPDAAVCPTTCPDFEDLISVADALLFAPKGDASVTSVAWAMAASTVVIGSADYSLAELIAHKQNGLLFKGGSEAEGIIRIAPLLADRPAQAACVQTARGQAYEVFGLKRFIDQHVRLYDNVLSGRPAAEGIDDSAVA